ncbi:MAG: TPM domain-containing protein, partial [Bacteroidota bacterium]
IRVFEKNKIGQKGKDNGVLIVVAKDDRLVRIDVGYGLEQVLTDAATSQIVEREMKPYFEAENFYAGLTSGVSSIIAATAGEYTVEPRGQSAPFISGILALFFIVFVLVIFLPMLAAKRRYVIRSSGWLYNSGWGWPSGGSGGGGWSGGSSGGGWSGGGGMAGGGGATGRW